MRTYLTTHLLIALMAGVTAILVIFSSWYIHNTLRSLESKLVENVREAQMSLAQLAEMTDRNDGDALTNKIISDCPRRPEFEDLLNRLGSVSGKELLHAQQLFESCGSFYAERKALMVAELEREYEALDSSLSLLSDIRDLTPEEVSLQKWQNLIELERKRSDFLSEQTQIQADIIALLIQGKKQTELQELVRQAQNVGQSLSVTDAQIDELRLSLL
jgi:hypothetical protein